jgi:hypothetical protein
MLSDAKPEGISIPLDEKATVLERFLGIICCLNVPAWESPADIVPLEILSTADKYEAEGAIAILRRIIFAAPEVSSSLILYRVAAQFGWEPEAKIVSTLSFVGALQHPRQRLHVHPTQLLASSFLPPRES